jgi:hypothetical protein
VTPGDARAGDATAPDPRDENMAAPVPRILGAVEIFYSQFAPKALLAYPVILRQQGRIFREFALQRHGVALEPRNIAVLRGGLKK